MKAKAQTLLLVLGVLVLIGGVSFNVWVSRAVERRRNLETQALRAQVQSLQAIVEHCSCPKDFQ